MKETIGKYAAHKKIDIHSRKGIALIVAVFLLVSVISGVTVAFLVANTPGVDNIFSPTEVEVVALSGVSRGANSTSMQTKTVTVNAHAATDGVYTNNGSSNDYYSNISYANYGSGEIYQTYYNGDEWYMYMNDDEYNDIEEHCATNNKNYARAIEVAESQYINFTFSGTRIKVYGGMNVDMAIAEIYLDDKLVATPDLFSDTHKTNVVLYDSGVINGGAHSVRVQWTDRVNEKWDDYLCDCTDADREACTIHPNKNHNKCVVVDAFEYTTDYVTINAAPAGTPIYSEQHVNGTGYAIETAEKATGITQVGDYTATVTTKGGHVNTSHGTVDGNIGNDEWYFKGGESTPGDYVECTFTGRGVQVVAGMNTDLGIADIYIDDVFVESVDLYDNLPFHPNIWKRGIVVFDSGVLTDGEHTIRVEYTGEKGLGSNSTIIVDAFRILPSINYTTINAHTTTPGLTHSGAWNNQTNTDNAGNRNLNNDEIAINAQGSYIEYKFIGSKIQVVGGKNADLGIAEVYIDNQLKGEIDAYAPNSEWRFDYVLYESDDLGVGEHTIKIVHTGRKNALNTYSPNAFVIDTFKVADFAPAVENENEGYSVYFRNDDEEADNVLNVDCFVKAGFTVNWVNETTGEVYGVAPIEGADYSININRTDWLYCEKDGMYYYRSALAQGQETACLINSVDLLDSAFVPRGCKLKVSTVVAGIQYYPETVVNEKWENVVATGRTLALNTNA